MDRRNDITQDEADRLRRFLEPGTEIAGSVAGAAIGLLVGGPPGAIIGAMVPTLATRAISHGAWELMNRQLSHREQVRAAGVAMVAAARIQRNLDLGYEARSDGFFEGEPGNRSAAEEIAEGVLIAAQREHEEKKLMYLGNLLGNIPFQKDISRGQANRLLQLVDRLSYRQLCLIALFGRKDEFPHLREGTFEELFRDAAIDANLVEIIGLLEEANELLDSGMLGQQRILLMAHGEGLNPANAELQRWGGVLYELMDLIEMPASELEPIAELLQ